jgi:geranylgeranyl diphosphate synthase type I
MRSLDSQLSTVSRKVREYLLARTREQSLKPSHLDSAARMYVQCGGKSMRPAMLLWSCSAVGGSEGEAVPAAAAVELYHTWTLVHDDIIDRDERRRGGLSVHAEFEGRGARELGLDARTAAHYGLSFAILAGDVQHAWAVGLLGRCPQAMRDPRLALRLVAELEGPVLSAIAQGEALDLQHALRPVGKVTERQILNMISLKTAALYSFAARAGGLLGLRSFQPRHPHVRALAKFGRLCGMAFQLQDDILGVLGEDKRLGKPVGSDIREGKRTTILSHAWKQASAQQRRTLSRALANPSANDEDIRQARRILLETGGIAHTRSLAREYVGAALEALKPVPASDSKRLLSQLAGAMIARTR